jgi:hypothetical protein
MLFGRGIKKRGVQTQLQQLVRQSFEERGKTQKETLAAPSVSACDEAAKEVVRRFLSCQV